MSRSQAAIHGRPYREDLLVLDPPRLLGSHCPVCGTISFPLRDFCPSCRTTHGLSRAALGPHGRIHTFTVVRQAPPGVPVPYVLAQVDLDDGVRVMATVVGADPAEVGLGTPVTLELAPVGAADDGTPLLLHRFRVVANGVAA